jgi:CAAX protease family protein
MDAYNPFLYLRARRLVAVGFAGEVLLVLAVLIIHNLLELELYGETELNLLFLFMYLWMFYWMQHTSGEVGIDLRNFVRGGKVSGIPKLVGLVVLLFLSAAGTTVLTGYVLSYLWPSMLDSGWWPGAAYRPSGLNSILYAVTAIVLAPVVEELLFRGLLLGRWTTKWGIRRAILASATLFAVLHPDIVGAFIFALCMSAMYLKSRTLLAPILSHALYNSVIVAWSFFPPDRTNTEGRADREVSHSTLLGAVELLVITLPLLIYYIYRNWPAKHDGTPPMRNPLLALEPTVLAEE